MDQFSRAIAKYAEKAYLLGQDVLVEQQKPRKGRTEKAASKTVNLKVTNMRCNFALDYKETIIFMYCEYLTIEIESGRREMEEQLKQETLSRETTAAQAVSKELLSLLHHAQQRGLKLEETFRHFDVGNNGFVDTDMLIDGMARLGMGVTYPVAEAVLEIIAGVGSAFFTSLDLDRFLRTKAADIETFEKLTDLEVDKKITDVYSADFESVQSLKSQQSTASSKRPKGGNMNEKSKKITVTAEQLLPPVKTFLPLKKGASDFKDLTASQSHSWETNFLDESKPSDRHLEDKSMELPIPEEEYSTLRSSNKTALPKYAAMRTKRALKELKRSETGRREFRKIEQKDSQEEAIQPRKIVGEGKKTANVGPLNLNAIANEVRLATAAVVANTQSKDELLHVDHGVIMTYRVIKGEGNIFEQRKTHEADDVLRYKSTLEMRERNLKSASGKDSKINGIGSENDTTSAASASEFTGSSTDKDIANKSFSIIIVPDIFMTLETLEQSFSSLLKKFPNAQLILVGLPGMPNTVWPKNWVLNSDLHSRAIAKLMQHLLSKNVINADRSVHQPILFVGFGAHCLCLSRFISLYLPLIPEVHYQTKAVTFLNGLLRHSKKFKQLCKDLRQSMMDSNAFEVNELITTLHLWDEYMSVNGRDVVLEKFWSSRRELRMNG